MEIDGKQRRHVPVILTPLMKEALELVINVRDKFIRNKENKYIFALPNGDFYHRAHDVIMKFSIECGAQNPESLRSTTLRKHLATHCQVIKHII